MDIRHPNPMTQASMDEAATKNTLVLPGKSSRTTSEPEWMLIEHVEADDGSTRSTWKNTITGELRYVGEIEWTLEY